MERVLRVVLLVCVAAVNLTGCAGQQHPLSAATAGGLNGRLLVTSSRRPTPFFLTKPAKNVANPYGAAGGLAIAAAMAEAGARVFRENAIADPAPRMAQQLGDELRRRFGVKVAPRAIYVDADDPTQVTAAYPAADLILDLWIDGVNLEPFPDDPSKYRVRYTSYLRLIDAKVVHAIDGKKGVLIADGTCSRRPEQPAIALTYDELLADGARRLKHELDVAAQSCVEEFRTKVLTAGPKS